MKQREPDLAGPWAELHFALAEGDAEQPGADLFGRLREAAVEARPPGRPTEPPAPVGGAASLRSAVAQLDTLLGDLGLGEWSQPALRDLDVQGLIGHLIGAERAFGDGLEGTREPPRASEHVASTQPSALAQLGRPPRETHQEWREQTARTLTLVEARDQRAGATYFGITMPLDEVLVVRAFEMWLHHEDIRRATSRPLMPPEPAVLARMVNLAMKMLPYGLARAGCLHPQQSVRLVLTGPSGGTWDVPLDGPGVVALPGPSHQADSLVVVDAAEFCRVVGNRGTLEGTALAVRGDLDLAADLFLGASHLALD